MSNAEDPILTTREAAAILGVSIKTAQNWIEQNLIESWKTPGGHRRVHESAVFALRDRLAATRPEQPVERAVALVIAAEPRLTAFVQIAASAGLKAIGESDALSAMLQAGVALPAWTVIDLRKGDWEKVSVARRLLQSPDMASMRILAITDLSRSQLEAELGALSRVTLVDASLDWRAVDAALRASLGSAVEIEPGTQSYPVASNEAARLDAVLRTGLVDTPHDPELDEIVRLAAETLQVPISLITLLTDDRQWFKARWGLSVSETPRAWAFCSYTILQNDVFTVPDAADDPRFRDNPLVTAEPRMRFYAGAAVRDLDGYALGALCAIDRQPRVIDETQKRRLLHLASLASDRLARRLNVRASRWQRAARAVKPV